MVLGLGLNCSLSLSPSASHPPSASQPFAGKSEYVQGLTPDECATLLNVDAYDDKIMEMIFDTAFAIKNRCGVGGVALSAARLEAVRGTGREGVGVR